MTIYILLGSPLVRCGPIMGSNGLNLFYIGTFASPELAKEAVEARHLTLKGLNPDSINWLMGEHGMEYLGNCTLGVLHYKILKDTVRG